MSVTSPPRKSRHRVIATQLIRFAASGVVCSVVYAIIYLPLANRALAPGRQVFAVLPAFVASAICGYVLNDRWSFRGKSKRLPSNARPLQFGLVQCIGGVVNGAFTWLVTVPLHGASWVALIPCFTITPLLTFSLQRRWVFI